MKTKTKFKLSKVFFWSFLLFWQIETWFFIVRDGWHTESIINAEKTCDKIAGFLFGLSVYFFFSIVYDIVYALVNAPVENNGWQSDGFIINGEKIK
jgi:hypothetical protein